jgi:hypothetical protein
MLFLRYYFWVAPHVLLILLLIRSFQRGLHRRLPIFFCFALFEFIQFLVLFAVSRILPPTSTEAYRWVLVPGAAISSCLQFGVIYELADELVLSRSSLAGVLGPGLRWGAAMLLLLSAVAGAMLPRISVQHVANIFQALDFTSSLLQTGLLLGLFLFSRVLHISWRNQSTGVALGFGVAASLELATAALRTYFGKSGFIAVDMVQMAAFHVSVVVWLVYVFLPERMPTFSGGSLPKSEIEFWNQELQRMVRR